MPSEAASEPVPKRDRLFGPGDGGAAWPLRAANDGDRHALWLDAAKGIGIVLVVVGHVLDGLFSAGIVERSGFALAVFYTIYVFHMPLFFFVSGLTAAISLRKGSSQFLRSRLWTVAYPYFLWSAVQGSTQLLFSGSVNTPMGSGYLLEILYRPIGQFWFLYALLFYHLCASLAGSHHGLMVAAALAGLAAYPLAPGVWYATAYYLVFYAAGILAAPRVMSWRPSLGWWKEGLLALAWLAIAVTVGALNGWRYVGLAVLPISALGVLATIRLGKALRGRMLRLAAALGTMSMTIYVLHVMAGAGARIALIALDVPRDPAVFVVLGTAAGILAPIAVHRALQRLGWLAAFGLAVPRWRQSRPAPLLGAR